MPAALLSLTRVCAFSSCGDSHWIMRNKDDPTKYRLVPDYCHDRFCKPCARTRSLVIAHNIRQLVKDHEARHITLTLRHRDEPLKDQLDRLYAAYRRLRQRKLWKARVDGAAAMLEVTWNPDTERWHPHLHVIAVGGYILLADLRAAWRGVTGDSHIVDIKLIRDDAKAAYYVAKYGSKAIDHAITTRPQVLTAAIYALTGRRAVLATGCWAHARITKRPADDSWKCVCHVCELHTTDRLDRKLVSALSTWLRELQAGTADPIITIDLPVQTPTQGPAP